MPLTNLVSLLPNTSHTALISTQGALTFEELHNLVSRTAAGLHKAGVRPGDRILLMMPMSNELYISLLALFWIDATVMLVDPSAPLESILKSYPPSGFIGSPKAHLLRLKFKTLRGLSLYISTGFIPLWHRRLSETVEEPIPISDAIHPALLTFTTGTTGIPKAMARSHSFLLAQHKALAHHMDFKDGDVDMPTLAVFLLHSLAAGATCVLPDADLKNVAEVNAESLIKQLEQHNVTSMSGAPAFFNALCTPMLEWGQQNKTIQKIFTGGGRVMASDVQRLQRCFPLAKITIVYGSTEAEPIATLNAIERISDLVKGEEMGLGALVGQPVDDITVKVVDDELWVTGAHVNTHYFQSPQADLENKINDGEHIWHRTGDAAVIKGNDIWLLGRVGESIHGNWPMPVEGMVLQLDFVKQAALVKYQGSAVLVLVCESLPSDWRTQVARRTELPVILHDHIPLDPRHNTKIDRKRLSELLAQSPQDIL